MTGRNEGDEAPHLDFKTRLRAWWEGYDLDAFYRQRRSQRGDDHAQRGIGDEPPVPQPGLNRQGKPLWTATRLQVAEKIWGTDFVSPGATEYLVHLITVLGLNKAMSVIDYSCGLGGVTRLMASKYGAWVLGLEASPLLREEATKRSAKAGLKKQAMIAPFDPEAFGSPKRVDAVFAKEAFFTVHNKNGVFDAVASCLKPGGQLLFTDFCLEDGVQPDQAIAAWCENEPQEPSLWTFNQTLAALEIRNLDVRIREDITNDYKASIQKAIQAFVQHLEKHMLDPETRMNVMEEIELWAHRSKALESGLRCFRFHGLKPLI